MIRKPGDVAPPAVTAALTMPDLVLVAPPESVAVDVNLPPLILVAPPEPVTISVAMPALVLIAPPASVEATIGMPDLVLIATPEPVTADISMPELVLVAQPEDEPRDESVADRDTFPDGSGLDPDGGGGELLPNGGGGSQTGCFGSYRVSLAKPVLLTGRVPIGRAETTFATVRSFVQNRVLEMNVDGTSLELTRGRDGRYRGSAVGDMGQRLHYVLTCGRGGNLDEFMIANDGRIYISRKLKLRPM